MADVDKITLERTEDGEHWRMQAEGDDVEGHLGKSGELTVEAQPAGEQDGEQLYKVDFGGDGTEGHRIYSSSDRRLKQAIRPL